MRALTPPSSRSPSPKTPTITPTLLPTHDPVPPLHLDDLDFTDLSAGIEDTPTAHTSRAPSTPLRPSLRSRPAAPTLRKLVRFLDRVDVHPRSPPPAKKRRTSRLPDPAIAAGLGRAGSPPRLLSPPATPPRIRSPDVPRPGVEYVRAGAVVARRRAKGEVRLEDQWGRRVVPVEAGARAVGFRVDLWPVVEDVREEEMGTGAWVRGRRGYRAGRV